MFRLRRASLKNLSTPSINLWLRHCLYINVLDILLYFWRYIQYFSLLCLLLIPCAATVLPCAELGSSGVWSNTDPEMCKKSFFFILSIVKPAKGTEPVTAGPTAPITARR